MPTIHQTRIKPLCILVIEPDDVIRKMYGIFLSKNPSKPRVILTESHDHVMALALQEKPDVLITNQGRPPHAFKGSTTSSLIKKLLPKTRTIMITGNNIPRPEGVDVMLRKPVVRPADIDLAIMCVLGTNGG